ncbi:toll-like receptor 13 [Haliotis rubra]|uniref:toll-like receptor 13 n=1 Tax=Haliotis rubra TaxID=36100 RepID=UPI001EE4F34A|nr:toll-like receptor 13 [Haliotis rubra]
MEIRWTRCFISVLCLMSVCHFQECLSTDCFHNWCWCKPYKGTCEYNEDRLQYVPRLQWAGDIYRFAFVHNHLKTITNSTFQNISQYTLHLLDLTHNHIAHISAGAFANLTHLLYLNVGDNPIALAELGEAFHSLPGVFEHLYLNRLNISDAGLEGSFLHGLQTKSLTAIHLAQNKLTKFDVTPFVSFKMLTCLNLWHNAIEWKRYHMIPKLESLQTLILDHNNLTEIPIMCVDHPQKPSFPNLKTLTINYNRIYTLVAGNFHCLRSLTKLIMSGNVIRSIKMFSFQRIVGLENLVISHNKANLTIQGQVFNPNLSNLDLSHSNIYYFNTSVFFNCTRIKTINLSGNDFSRGDKYFFRYLLGRAMNTIESFHCKRCGLRQIPSVFSEMGRLKELHLSENSIQDIQNNFFDSNHHLRKLSLANNSIKTLSRLAFSNSVRKELHHVHLENNPFVCNCDLFWLKHWLLSETTKFSNHLSKYTCSNVPFQGKNLVDITSINSSDCSETRKRFSIVYCIAGTVLICLCFFGLGYRFRRNIRYCCLTFKSSASESIPLLRNDVYILYSDEDYLWVRYEALDKLENEGKQKVCFRQRDFNPKKYVVDNVVTNLRRCRKVIAVLSNSFFKDRASQFEMSLVRKRLERHKEMLVLVLLEDIENRYMSHSVNSMMQACLTIKWSEMNDQRDAFWEQLLTHV